MFFLFVGVCVACVMLIPGMEEQLNKVSIFFLTKYTYSVCMHETDFFVLEAE